MRLEVGLLYLLLMQKLALIDPCSARFTGAMTRTSVDFGRQACFTSSMLTAGESQESPIGAGRVLSLIRDGEAVTRADLARRTGLARSTVAQRVEALLAHQLVYEAGGSASTGGRPPTVRTRRSSRARRARDAPRGAPPCPRSPPS